MSKRNIVHVEIPAENLGKAGEFYGELFGWNIKQVPEMDDYLMWVTGDGSGGGFMPVSSEYPAGQVLVYIASDDIEEDLEKVMELGGKIVREKTEIPGMGWYGVFEDPTGNVLALYTDLKG